MTLIFFHYLSTKPVFYTSTWIQLCVIFNLYLCLCSHVIHDLTNVSCFLKMSLSAFFLTCENLILTEETENIIEYKTLGMTIFYLSSLLSTWKVRSITEVHCRQRMTNVLGFGRSVFISWHSTKHRHISQQNVNTLLQHVANTYWNLLARRENWPATEKLLSGGRLWSLDTSGFSL